MRINEFISEAKVGDRLKSFAYQNLGGMGGNAWLKTSGKVGFLDNFQQELKHYKEASIDSGTKPDFKDFVLTYLDKNGWQATGSQVSQAAMMANKPEQMANFIYKLTMSQSVAKQAGINKASAARGMRNPRQGQPAADLSSVSQQVITTIDKLQGAGNLDDLEAIAKKAMQVLYAQSPVKYSELYKEIMAGRSKPAVDMSHPADGTNAQSGLGSNE